MSSVIDYIECPNCKGEAFSDYYFRSGEEYVNCNECGYHYSQVIINRDKKLSELTNDDWVIKELKKPFGAYSIKYKDSFVTENGSIPSGKYYDIFVLNIKKETDIESCTISRFIDNEIIKEVII